MTNHYVIVKFYHYVISMLRNTKKLSINSSLSYYFRVSADIEIKGMDTEKHNEPAYPDIAKGHGYDKEINARLARNSVVPGDIPNLSYGKNTPSDV